MGLVLVTLNTTAQKTVVDTTTYKVIAAGPQYKKNAVFVDLAYYFASVGVPRNRAQRNFKYLVFAARSRAILFFTRRTGSSDDVLAVFQVKQSPELRIAAQNNVPTFPSVSSIRTTVRH
jgi:hypothetical protein